MDNLQAFTITLFVLLIGFLSLYTLFQILQIIFKKPFSLHFLIFGFKQKMWMTVGLGLFFFGFYIVLMWLASLTLDPKTKLALFFAVYENPKNYIYLGLSIFVSLSLSIYLARRVIIYFYNSKKR